MRFFFRGWRSLNIRGGLFILIYLGLSFLYYEPVLDKGPWAEHLWRQTDGLSIAYVYMKEDQGFFHPKVLNLINGRSSEAVSEFPIWYYLTARAYELIGFDDRMLKGFYWLVFSIGLFAFWRILLHRSKNFLLSSTFAWTMYSLPVITYYAFNYVPDIFSLGCSLWGFAVIKGSGDSGKRSMIGGSFLFLLASLNKVTFALLPAAWLGLIAYRRIVRGKRTFGTNDLYAVAGFLTVLLLSLIWILWARHYNELHNSWIFLTEPRPAWNMSLSETGEMFRQFKNSLHGQGPPWEVLGEARYGSFSPWYALAFLILSLAFISRIKRRHWILFSLVMIQVLGILLLFLPQFLSHDYYGILAALPLFILGYMTIPKLAAWLRFKGKYYIIPVYALVLIIMVFEIINTDRYLNYTYSKQHHWFSKRYNWDLFEREKVKAFKERNHLNYEDSRLISYPDISPNATLYLMGLKGYTTLNGGPKEGAFKDHISRGATHVLITDSTAFDKYPFLYEFTDHPLDTLGGNAFLYDVRPYR